MAKKSAAPKKVAPKKSAPKKVAPKKTAKKAATKKAGRPKGQGKEGPTIRAQVFKLLSDHVDGLTGKQIQEKLELKNIPALLKDEGMRTDQPPRITRQKREGVRGVVYSLTVSGKKAVKNDTVDKEAAESSAGKEWPEGK